MVWVFFLKLVDTAGVNCALNGSPNWILEHGVDYAMKSLSLYDDRALKAYLC